MYWDATGEIATNCGNSHYYYYYFLEGKMTVKIGDRFKSNSDTIEVVRVTKNTIVTKADRSPTPEMELGAKSFQSILKAGGYKQIKSKNQENSTFRGTKPYLVMSKGVIVATEYDRERAREIKAQLGGKKSGVTIQRVSLVEEVR